MTYPPIELFTGLFDDAAIFPPGNTPLAEAVDAHIAHRAAPHSAFVGPLVVAHKDLDELGGIVAATPERPSAGRLDVAVTVSLPELADCVQAVAQIPQMRLAALEIALPASSQSQEVIATLRPAPLPHLDAQVFVEIPLDARQEPLLAVLSGTEYLAKFRTGGIRAELYPDETELARSVLAAIRAGVAFKATAGLHHAFRNTDPITGFEQHGFLNLLAATGVALAGGTMDELAQILADRDSEHISAHIRALHPRVRAAFRSFGTCSIAEPVSELAAHGLVAPRLAEELV